MRMLAVVGRGYYGHRSVPEPMYLYFTSAPAQLGHEVLHFDHVKAAREHGVAAATAELEETIHREKPQVVLYQHAPTRPEPIDTSMFAGLRDRCCIAAWNSDDDWQASLTLPRASHFTWMVTTYPQVLAEHGAGVPNLLLSQWGCLGTYASPAFVRDIDFSFAGQVYPSRVRPLRHLRRRTGLQVFGKGSRLVRLPVPPVRGASRFGLLAGPPLDFADINDVWNRTAVSYTPLQGGPRGDVLSLKSRIFDMGLSGTVMLCDEAPHLADYYEPGRECVTFGSLEECVEQAEALLADPERRARIADAYARRTRAEHLWTHRFERLFAEMGA